MGSELSRTVQLWERLVEGLSGGKCVGDARYVHVSAVPTALAETLAAVIACAGCTPAEVDVVKVSRARPRVSLLRYPGFFTEGFPTLRNVSMSLRQFSIQFSEHLVDARGSYPRSPRAPWARRTAARPTSLRSSPSAG